MGIPAKVSLLYRVKFDHSGCEVLQIVEIGTIMRNLQVVMLTDSRCIGAMPLSHRFFVKSVDVQWLLNES